MHRIVTILGPNTPDWKLFVSWVIEVGLYVWKTFKLFHKPINHMHISTVRI